MTTRKATMYTSTDAIDKLATLGSSRQIADFLTERGCLGWPTTPDRCPVARYVAIETLDPVSVVSQHWYRDTSSGRLGNDMHHLPDAVRAFVFDFDAGEYPHLVDPDYHVAEREKIDQLMRELGLGSS